MYRRSNALKTVVPSNPRLRSVAGTSSALALAVFVCGFGLKTPEALALSDENWINETIALGNGDADGWRSRRTAPQARRASRQDDDDDDDDNVRPQRHLYRAYRASDEENGRSRHGRRGARLASLGRVAAAASEDLDEPVRRPATARRHGKIRLASLGQQHVAPSRAVPSQSARASRQKPRRTRVASLGRDFVAPSPSKAPSLSGGGSIRWLASAGCLASSLRSVLEQVAANFGPLRVNSTCRSRRHNARVGGARHSYHLSGHAVDFRVSGNARRVISFLRGNGAVGGLKHYGHGLFHIDTGPRRSW
jgi:hypothetical protein